MSQDVRFDISRALIEQLLRRTALDVGAGRGSFVSVCLDSGCDPVHAFEPESGHAEHLRVQFGADPRVRIHEYALGAADGIDARSVTVRSLHSLLNEGLISPQVGLLNVGAGGNCLEVLEGLGPIECEVVIAQFWNEPADGHGSRPYAVTDLVQLMKSRGFGNFLVLRKRDELALALVNDDRTSADERGQVVFVHDEREAELAPVLVDAAARVQDDLLHRAVEYRMAADRYSELAESAESAARRSEALLKRSRRAAELQQSRAEMQSEVLQKTETQLEKQRELLQLKDEQLAKIRADLLQAYALHRIVSLVPRPIRRIVAKPTPSGTRLRFEPRLHLAQYEARPMKVSDRYERTEAPQDPPSISIVTPSLNQGTYIEATIKSVLDQGYPHLEYIVKDGGSDDATVSVVERYRDRLHHWESTPDYGQASAINAGFRHTSGEIMAYLNADDLLLPGSLAYVGRYFLDHPDVDVIYSHRIIVDAEGQEIGRWLLPRHDSKTLLWADYVPQETLFWRRSLWEEVGAEIREDLDFAIDWDLLLRFRRAEARFARVPRFLGAFRFHGESKTAGALDLLGAREMQEVRQGWHGRPVERKEVRRALRGFYVRQGLYDRLYRARILRY